MGIDSLLELVSDIEIHPPTAGRGSFRIALRLHRIWLHAGNVSSAYGKCPLHLGIACEKIFEELSVSNETTISSRKLALACADFLWRQGDAPRILGLERLSIKLGHATVAMTVLPAMVDGLGVTNGGAIFTFADTTFSLASNTYNERTVAAHCCISFLRPTRLGDRLVATATEVVRSARSGIYDVSVTLENMVVAEFRAHSRIIGGPVLSVATAGQDCTAAEAVNQ